MSETRGARWALKPLIQATAIAVASMGCIGEVTAFEIPLGESDVKARWDNTFKYSTAYRLSDPSERVAGGDAGMPPPGPQLDDGDRNFKKGIVSNRLDWFSELDVSYKNVGARVSSAAWYDSIYGQSNDNHSGTVNSTSVPAGEFTNATRDMMGRKAEILDAFVYFKSSDDAETPFSVRVGRHTVLYGESLFFGSNGIANAQAPVDLIKLLSVPGSQFKEIIRPVGQVSTQVQLAPKLSIGAYYQYEWEKSRLPPSGSYLSDADFVGAGAESLLGMRKVHDDKPDSFQGGIQTRFKLGESDIEYGLYAAQYSDKGPQIMLDTPAVFGGAAANTFHFVYPEKIKTIGASFSTVLGEANVAGEVSYRWNAPLVSAPQPDQGLRSNGTENPFYAVGKTLHAQVSGIYLMSKSPFWDGAELLGELAWNRTLSVDKNPLALDPNVTRDAMAFRVIFSPQYFQVLSGVDVSVPIGLGYNPYGRSSAVTKFNGGVEHGGDFSVGISGSYKKQVKFGLTYNHFFGKENAFLTPNTTSIPGPFMTSGAQSLRDRDFISFAIQSTF